MKNTTTGAAPATHGFIVMLNAVAGKFEMLINHAVLALTARIAVAAIFILSGRTKVDGWLTVNDTAVALFRDEYKVPILPPEFAAHMATYAEHFFPLLLVLGLFTRYAALALFGMTLVIQIFVYPSAWPTHLSWAAPMLYLIARGAGPVSLDQALKIK